VEGRTAAVMTPAAQVEAEAAAWLARRDGDAWSPGEEAELDVWLAASTAHRVAFLRLQAAWSKADRLRAVGLPDAIDEMRGEAPKPRAVPTWPRVRWLIPVAAAAALALLALPTWMVIDAPGQAHSTAVGGFQRLPLDDGSHIELNTNSSVDVVYTARERRIALDRGEALFKVARDERRPFVVEAGAYRITAVGTEFAIRLADEQVSVAVTEGRVRLDRLRAGRSPEPVTFLSAGQRLEGRPSAAIVSPVPIEELEQSLSWREGLLVFDNQPLADVAAEFNRYNRRQLVVDPSAASVSVSGSFRATNLDGFLRLLEQGFSVRPAVRDRDEVVLRRS